MRVMKTLNKNTKKGLNPCFNGICSMSGLVQKIMDHSNKVLILVLMEYAQ